jgi:hypothetical protein
MIAYSSTGITITDDRDPSRPPLVLPVGSTSAEVEAAVAEYSPPDPQPDYDGFGIWLLTTPEIQQAYDIAFEGNKLWAGSLPPAVLVAADGEPKHLRTTLLLLRRQGLLSQETLAAMLAAGQQCNLPPEFLQALGG